MLRRPDGGTVRWLGLVAVVASAAALRLYGLEVQSLWHDELFVWHALQAPTLKQAMVIGAAEDVHPPGYIALMWAWTACFGDSEVALRLPAALAGIAAVLGMIRLGGQWFDPATGMAAGALTSASWMAIYYSQEGRPYALLFLGTIVLAHRIGSALRLPDATPPGRRRRAVGEVILVCLALGYLHYFGLLIATAAVLVWGIAARSVTIPAIVGGGIAVGYTPWIATLTAQVSRGEVWIDPPTAATVYDVYATLANGAPGSMLILWALGLAAAGGRLARRDTYGPLAILAAWATVPMVGAVALSMAVLPVVTDRNLIIVLPAILLLSAWSATQIDRYWLRGLPVATIGIIVALGIDLIGVRDHYRVPTKWQYRQVVDTIITESVPGAFIVSGAWHADYFDYYFEQRSVPQRVDASAKGPRRIARALPTPRPATVFVAAPRARAKGQLRLAGYVLGHHWPFIGWELYRFDQPSD